VRLCTDINTLDLFSATTVEKVGERICKKALKDGAYIDVPEGKGIMIPADTIVGD